MKNLYIKRFRQICLESITISPKYGYKETFSTDFKMQYHRHNVIEIMYAYNRTFGLDIWHGNKQKTIVVPTGKFMVINSGVYHRLNITNDDTRILNIEFINDENNPMAANMNPLYLYSKDFHLFADADPDYLVLDGHKKTRTLLEQILTLLMDNKEQLSYDLPYRNNDAEQLLLLQQYTLQFFLQCSKIFLHSSTLKDSKHVLNAIQYINDFLTVEELSVKKIADHLHINPAYLSALFKHHTEINLVTYINKQRVFRAMSFLANSNMSVYDIGILVGFNNRQHFTRVFKQFINCSPLEYRTTFIENTIKNYEIDEAYPTDYFNG